MRKNAFLRIARTVTCWMAVLALVGGCSALRAGKSSRDLREEVAKAQRLYSRAAASMTNPVHMILGQLTPIAGETRGVDANDSNQVSFPDVAVHPKAMDDLKSAEDDLRKALVDGADAEDAVKATAYRMLANIQVLRGINKMM